MHKALLNYSMINVKRFSFFSFPPVLFLTILRPTKKALKFMENISNLRYAYDIIDKITRIE